jgi:hypothetical protein
MLNRLTAAGLILLLGAAPASAGVYSDDLSKCLVAATDGEGQTQLIVWVFSIMTLNPAVAPYASVTDAQRQTINKNAGTLYSRLLTDTCRKQTVAALKYEGVSSIEHAFETLGGVAMRGLLNDPKVMAGMGALGAGFDKAAMADLAKEAGVATPPASH